MEFNSNIFIFLMLPLVIVYGTLIRTTKNHILRVIGLITFNMCFYIFAGIKALFFIVLYAFVVYMCCRLIRSCRYKIVHFMCSILLLLPLLFSIINGREWSVLGISFFTFEAVSLLADVMLGKIEEINSYEILSYIMFFPVVTSGPILRFGRFRESFFDYSNNVSDIADGITRFVWGLSKKLLIADRVAVIADYYFTGVTRGCTYSVLGMWLGAVAYTIQIYMDFSGYSDMAIGIGQIVGFDIPENFDKPYSSTTMSDFWKRWHMTLTNWFRDYIYIPLGGNRCSVARHIFNMTIVWLLTGIWHGVDSTFIIWSIGNLCILLIEKYCKRLYMFMKDTPFGHFYTLFCVILLWVPFRSESVQSMIEYYKGLIGIRNANILYEKVLIDYLPYTCVLLILFFAINIMSKMKNRYKVINDIYVYGRSIINILAFIVCICVSVNSTYAPYVYGKF